VENFKEKLIVASSEWCEEAEQVFAHPVFDDSRHRIRAEFAAGGALFRVSRGGALVGFYLLTVQGCDGVLFAAAGRDAQDLTDLILPIVETQFIGCAALLIYTQRPGMAAKLVKRGYEPRMVLRKDL